MPSETIIQQLREVAGHLWPEMVLYTYFQAVAIVIACLIIIPILLYVNIPVWRWAIRNTREQLDEDYYFPAVVVTSVTTIGTILTVVMLVHNVAVMLAPEGATVMRMLGK